MKKLPGVFSSRRKNGTLYYRSSVTYQGKHISLGSFQNAEEAHLAYSQALSLLHSPIPLMPGDHSPKNTVLPFTKWVILTNYKNNGLYIKTPIYLHKKFFHYYLSPQDVLTFDTDDLFYYSSHSIMRRGNHLFVADYGMQVNILSRYGIKNFAVPGRDYVFINGDQRDFRYSNIQVINAYHGVSREKQGNSVYYLAKIHINGDYIIGRYHTPALAATAYNKAADILNEKGIEKNFPRNYIEELSSEDYNRLYSTVMISERILNYADPLRR